MGNDCGISYLDGFVSHSCVGFWTLAFGKTTIPLFAYFVILDENLYFHS